MPATRAFHQAGGQRSSRMPGWRAPPARCCRRRAIPRPAYRAPIARAAGRPSMGRGAGASCGDRAGKPPSTWRRRRRSTSLAASAASPLAVAFGRLESYFHRPPVLVADRDGHADVGVKGLRGFLPHVATWLPTSMRTVPLSRRRAAERISGFRADDLAQGGVQRGNVAALDECRSVNGNRLADLGAPGDRSLSLAGDGAPARSPSRARRPAGRPGRWRCATWR